MKLTRMQCCQVSCWCCGNVSFLRMALYVIVWLVAGCMSLKDVRIIVPMAVERGQSAALQCFYDLEGDQLYAAKWYRRGREFYRYTPRDDPPSKTFPLEGVNVVLENSNGTHVLLSNVSVNTSGEYRCEISADAPSFFTKIEAAMLEVVEIPKHDPVISGLKSRYRLDDILKAECRSKDSRPAANLTWLANDLPVDQAKIRRHHPHHSEHNTLYSAHSGLHLKLSRAHFASGRLKIRCLASLYNVYYRSSEKSVELERPKRKGSNGQQNQHYSGISNTLYTVGATSIPAYGSGVPATTNYWEHDSLPAERAPQTTLIFSMANDYPNSAVKLATLSYLTFFLVLLL